MIRAATPDDAEAMDAMLRGLSRHTGDLDAHRGDATGLRRDFGLFRALIAEQGSKAVGMILFFPYYSTIRGAAGMYVQDLFVDAVARGSGLGRALLTAAARQAQQDWGARFLILSAARANDTALRFYGRLGLTRHEDEVQLSLEHDAFARLTGDTA